MISGIIYAILDDEYYYIGSTTKPLIERIEKHKLSCKETSKKYSKLYNYINNVKGSWENIIYITLQEVLCKNKNELEKIEYNYINKHINDEHCLNILSNYKQKHIIFKNKK